MYERRTQTEAGWTPVSKRGTNYLSVGERILARRDKSSRAKRIVFLSFIFNYGSKAGEVEGDITALYSLSLCLSLQGLPSSAVTCRLGIASQGFAAAFVDSLVHLKV